MRSSSSPSAALAAAFSVANGSVGGRRALLRGPAARGLVSPLLRLDRGWQVDRESRRVIDRERRCPAEDREHAAPPDDQVLLDDRREGRDERVEDEDSGPTRA